jgi:hypothetical protein
LGSGLVPEPLPVGLVAVSEYESKGKWRPRRLSPGRAALVLLKHTVSARNQPKLALSLLPRVTLQTPVLKSVRGDAEQMVNDLLCRSYWS